MEITHFKAREKYHKIDEKINKIFNFFNIDYLLS